MGNKSSLTIIILALAVLALLTIADRLLSERIENNQTAYSLKEVKAVMPITNILDISEDQFEFTGLQYLSSDKPLNIFRQWHAEKPAGIVLAPIITNGYNNKIALCVGLYPNGSISNVRILEHKETKNLGDQIHQSNSNWLQQFKDKSLSKIESKNWKLKQNGGLFDGISGASITSRAVINVIHDTLKFYDKEKKSIYSK